MLSILDRFPPLLSRCDKTHKSFAAFLDQVDLRSLLRTIPGGLRDTDDLLGSFTIAVVRGADGEVTTRIEPTAEAGFERVRFDDGTFCHQLKLWGDTGTYLPRVFINGVCVGQDYGYHT